MVYCGDDDKVVDSREERTAEREPPPTKPPPIATQLVPESFMSALRDRLKSLWPTRITGTEALVNRVKRRRAIYARIGQVIPYLRILLLIAGYAWTILIPLEQLSRGTYIDENALQPGQVTTYWDWKDVRAADGYLEQLEALRDRNASRSERAEYLRDEFAALGIPSATQAYSFQTSFGPVNGTNAYAVHSSPRISGAEALVISASWISRTGEGDGTLNLRGVATVLALSGFLKRYSLWAKDLVFVISDGYMDGMQAWLNAYHGAEQSNLMVEPLSLDSGVIWTALALDYPGHSFSHVGLYFEGLNGRLPNQDLLNSVAHITRWTANVPVILYDHIDELRPDLPFSWLPGPIRTLLNARKLKEFEYRGKNVVKQLTYQASMRGSGIHGLFHQFRIDAMTLFAIPATGPHGFHALGRAVESSLRTMNNLLERLHASVFFYILTSPTTFMNIGNYLPAAGLVGISCLIGGLKLWVDAGWYLAGGEKSVPVWQQRQRPVIHALKIITAAFAWGGVMFLVCSTRWFAGKLESPIMTVVYRCTLSVFMFPFLAQGFLGDAGIYNVVLPGSTRAALGATLKSCLLLLISLLITSSAVLNFASALMLSFLALPLIFVKPVKAPGARWLTVLALSYLLPNMSLLQGPSTKELMRRAIWEWQVLGVGMTPFACLIWAPLVYIAQVVCVVEEAEETKDVQNAPTSTARPVDQIRSQPRRRRIG